MALKTVTKLLLSKQAPLSIDMQTAQLADQSIVHDVENNDFEYIDHSDAVAAIEQNRRFQTTNSLFCLSRFVPVLWKKTMFLVSTSLPMINA